jgi:hypothetical protein
MSTLDLKSSSKTARIKFKKMKKMVSDSQIVLEVMIFVRKQ